MAKNAPRGQRFLHQNLRETNSAPRIARNIKSTQPAIRKKVSSSGKNVDERRFCILLNPSCRKVNLKAVSNMVPDAKVTIGQTEMVIDLVKSAIGSKNQMSWEENSAPTKRKMRIEYLM